MTETKRRIQELTKALPHMREKVAAVAVLFVLSLTLMVSVSYAWYTLSMKPELGGVNTTVSANGNLEIALSDLDGKEPEPSGVDDSFGANGQTVHGANTTWGNLINISNGYGLESLVLRPAKFDPQSMTYLSSALYGSDGRVEDTTSNFAFTTWKINETLGKYEFAVPVEDGELYDAYGVRAISTVTLGDVGSALEEKMVYPNELCDEAGEEYIRIMQNQQYMDTIKQVVQIYLNYNMYEILSRNNMGFLASGRDNSDITKHTSALRSLYSDFYNKAILKFGDALTELANIQLALNGYSTDPKNEGKENYRKKFGPDNLLVSHTAAALAKDGVNLGTSFTTYQKLEKMVREDMNALNQHCETYAVVYLNPDQHTQKYGETGSSTLLNIVNNLINIMSAKVDGTPISTLLGSGSTALGYINGLSNGDTVEVLVTKGAIWDFEALTDAHMNMTLTNLDMILKTVHGHMVSNAQGRMFSNAVSLTQNMDASFAAGMVADNTYGMALDLWFRTNSGSEEDNNRTLLTLDGLPELEISYERRMFLPSGETEAVPVSVFMRDTDAVIGGVRMQEEVLVYKKPYDVNGDGIIGDGTDMDGDGTIEDSEKEETAYFDCVAYEPVYRTKIVNKKDDAGNDLKDEAGNVITEVVNTDQYITDADVTDKMDKIETVIGFTSSNRIWKEGELVLDHNEVSASQGSGSCYVFYADTPEQADSAMELLRHMKLAFVDENGTMTSQAIMDVDYVYAQGGKYTVPLRITNSTSTIVNEAGEEVLGVAPLTKNVAQRVSVIVYLEGEDLENSMVLSRDEIVGSLNLQFSTVDDLRSMKDTALAMDTVALRAEIEGGAAMADTTGQVVTVEFDGSIVSRKLTAYVEGLTPAKVEAVFLRQINATQGRQMDPIVLTNTSGSVYEGTTAFAKPGTYVLRSLRLDGIEYDLPEEYYITVVVDGYAVKSVSFCETEGSNLALTTDSSAQREVTVEFDTSLEAQPTAVEAHFTTEDGLPVSTKLRRGSDGYWTGTANFTASGTYKLQYIVVDRNDTFEGEYIELPVDPATGDWKTFTAYLGLRAQVTLEHYVEDESGMPVNRLTFEYEGNVEKVNIRADILTDTGEKLMGFAGVTLNYGKRGTSLQEAGLSANLKWQNQQYCGEFEVDKLGVFTFSSLKVGTANTITNATYADTITVRSKEPPIYGGAEGMSSLMVLGSNEDAVYSAKLKNADGADTVTAVFTNPVLVDSNTGKPVEKVVEMIKTNSSSAVMLAEAQTDDYSVFSFKMPANDSISSQNGVWTLKELRVYGVYDSSGSFYGTADGTPNGALAEGAKGAYYTLAGQSADVYTVVDKVTLDKVPAVQVLGSATTTTFMTQHALNTLQDYGFTLAFPGFETKTVEEKDLYSLITGAELKLIHNASTSSSYGGYSYPAQDKATFETTTVALAKAAATNGRWVIPSSVNEKVWLAGTYDYSLTYKLTNPQTQTTYSYTITSVEGEGADDVLKVYSKKPTVTVESTSPAASTTQTIYTTSTPSSKGQLQTGSFFKTTSTKATVYLTTSSNNAFTIGIPEVTLKLADVPSGYTSATMTFITSNSNSVDSAFSFSNGVATAKVGNAKNGSSSWSGDTYPVLYPAGLMTQDEIKITYSGVEYTAAVEEITIEQPVSPVMIEFVGIPSTYTKPLPNTIIGEGASITIKLPALDWVATYDQQTNANTAWSSYEPVEEIEEGKVYGYKEYKTKDLFIFTTQHKDYQYYDWWRFESSATDTFQTYQQDKKIVKWIIDGVTYNAGTEYTFTKQGVLTAAAVVSDVGEPTPIGVPEAKTQTKSLYGYIKGQEVKDQEVAGYFGHTASGQMIGEKQTSQNSAYPTVKLADETTANAATDTIGTNMTDDPKDYKRFWPS